MKFKLRQPLGYTQQGRKDQQEDAVYPLFDDVSDADRVIVLCDGVGGSMHGEVASQTASKVIYETLTEELEAKTALTEDDAAAAVERAYDALDDVDTRDGQLSMATTLTCVAFHEDGVLAAHMGDSRIYQIRPSVGILYQSADHSLVNALLQAGELTPEEAKTFPRKNVITKALQPHGKRIKAEIHQLTDIKSGDYFFLCCDGVLEQLTNERLVEILSMPLSDKEKIRLLEAESTDRTKDNYTAYLVPVAEVEGESSLDICEDCVVVNIDETDEMAGEEETAVEHVVASAENTEEGQLAADEEEKQEDSVEIDVPEAADNQDVEIDVNGTAENSAVEIEVNGTAEKPAVEIEVNGTAEKPGVQAKTDSPKDSFFSKILGFLKPSSPKEQTNGGKETEKPEEGKEAEKSEGQEPLEH